MLAMCRSNYMASGPNLMLCGHDIQRSAGPNPRTLFSFVWIVDYYNHKS